MKNDTSSLRTAVKSGRKEVCESSMGSKGTREAVKTLTTEFVAMGQRSTNLGLSLQNLGASYITMVSHMKASVKALETKFKGLGMERGAENGGSSVPPEKELGGRVLEGDERTKHANFSRQRIHKRLP
jgi:hypothetical protein